MSPRRKELRRLLHYAKGLGLRITHRPYSRKVGYAAIYHSKEGEDSHLIIYLHSGSTLIEQVLTLIHEIGHHRDFIDYGRRDYPRDSSSWTEKKKLSKKERRALLQGEKRGARFWEQIYRDVGCTFPIQKLWAQKEFDLWQYEFLLENGRWPSEDEDIDRLNFIRRKHGV